jgi:hypothetical protein
MIKGDSNIGVDAGFLACWKKAMPAPLAALVDVSSWSNKISRSGRTPHAACYAIR